MNSTYTNHELNSTNGKYFKVTVPLSINQILIAFWARRYQHTESHGFFCDDKYQHHYLGFHEDKSVTTLETLIRSAFEGSEEYNLNMAINIIETKLDFEKEIKNSTGFIAIT